MTRFLTEKFLSITKNQFPELASLTKLFTPPQRLFINIPILLRHNHTQQSSRIIGPRKYSLHTQTNIPKDQSILMVSAETCLTSMQFSGAERPRKYRLEETLRQMIGQMKEVDNNIREDFYKLYKIVIQMLANTAAPELPLHEYLRSLVKDSNPNADAKQRKLVDFQKFVINDEFLRLFLSDTIRGPLLGNKERHDVCRLKLGENMLGKESSEIFYMECLAKSKSIKLNDHLIYCPLVDMIRHDVRPNCAVEGIHLTHLQQSYINIKSERAIEAGEQLQIGYGDYSNLDLFINQRTVYKNNPHNYMILPVDYSDLTELQQLHELKMNLYDTIGGLKEYLRIVKGPDVIHPDSLRMLRILFLASADIDKNKSIMAFSASDFDLPVSESHENRVREFVYRALNEVDISRLGDIDATLMQHKGDSTIQAIKYLEHEQLEIVLEALTRLNDWKQAKSAKQ